MADDQGQKGRAGLSRSRTLRYLLHNFGTVLIMTIIAGVVVLVIELRLKGEAASGDSVNLSASREADENLLAFENNEIPVDALNAVGSQVPADRQPPEQVDARNQQSTIEPARGEQGDPPPADPQEKTDQIQIADVPQRPRQPSRSANCPTTHLGISFAKPSASYRFELITGDDSVRMMDCDLNSGEFATEFRAGNGSLPNTGGKIRDDRITFDFGHLVNNRWNQHVSCTVKANAVVPRKRYQGEIACSVLNDDHAFKAGNVLIEL